MLANQSIINALATQGYCVIDQALEPSLAQALWQVAFDFQNDFSRAGIGRGDDHQLASNIRRDEISWIQGDTQATRQLMQAMQALQSDLNKYAYLGLKRFEAHYAHYPPGGFYKKHLDAFRGQSNRVVTLVYYLNPNWQPEHGGCLRLYDETDQFLLDIEPTFNRLVIFMSEEFPHEVLPTHQDRYSIAGWFRTDQLDALLGQ
ncbi:2OG-Fe(II) oxygenase [Salinibius halmophilus]|uniref:2OG-Fe(II) oxygenase n=1 Tax=Salinibius halmophilus TaxID=1853216 RepID=UPI000E672BAD|nr:2OG-Fe(II) oxygenase [Salinibius halmophilus]